MVLNSMDPPDSDTAKNPQAAGQTCLTNKKPPEELLSKIKRYVPPTPEKKTLRL